MELIKFRDEKRIVIDLETDDPDLETLGAGVRRGGYIVGVGIKVGDWKKYLPVRHQMDGQIHPMNLEAEKVFQWLKEEGAEFKGELIGAGLLYDMDYLAEEGCHFRNAKIIDIQTAEPLLDDNRFSYSLNAIAGVRFGEQKADEHMIAKYGTNWIKDIKNCSIADTELYVFGDLDLPERIWNQQRLELMREGLYPLFELERKLFHMLLFMKRTGVRIDLRRAEEVGDIFLKRMNEHMVEIKRIGNIKGEFNINSTKQKAELLDQCGVPYKYRKPTAKMIERGVEAGLSRKEIIGNPFLAKKALAGIPGNHPIINHLIACKEYEHAYGTFIRNYIFRDNIKGRLHCQFNQLKSDGGGTISGRFSSSKPNLQNIPSPEDDVNDPMYGNDRGALIRSCFIPEEGEKWWTRDWSQIEYRLLVHYAELTRCKGGREAAEMYRNDPNTDFHAMVQDMTGLSRKPTKTINFGVCYGMGVPALALSLKVQKHEAEEFLESYHGKVPFVQELFKKASHTAETQGNIHTLLKRKRRWDFWAKKYMNSFERENYKPLTKIEAEEKYGAGQISRAFTHKGLNALLQGGAADLMKLAMVQIWESGLAEKTTVNLTVHDELNGSIPDSKEALEALKETTHIMETCFKLKVPLIASGNEGNNWYEAK